PRASAAIAHPRSNTLELPKMLPGRLTVAGRASGAHPALPPRSAPPAPPVHSHLPTVEPPGGYRTRTPTAPAIGPERVPTALVLPPRPLSGSSVHAAAATSPHRYHPVAVRRHIRGSFPASRSAERVALCAYHSP